MASAESLFELFDLPIASLKLPTGVARVLLSFGSTLREVSRAYERMSEEDEDGDDDDEEGEGYPVLGSPRSESQRIADRDRARRRKFRVISLPGTPGSPRTAAVDVPALRAETGVPGYEQITVALIGSFGYPERAPFLAPGVVRIRPNKISAARRFLTDRGFEEDSW